MNYWSNYSNASNTQDAQAPPPPQTDIQNHSRGLTGPEPLNLSSCRIVLLCFVWKCPPKRKENHKIEQLIDSNGIDSYPWCGYAWIVWEMLRCKEGVMILAVLFGSFKIPNHALGLITSKHSSHPKAPIENQILVCPSLQAQTLVNSKAEQSVWTIRLCCLHHLLHIPHRICTILVVVVLDIIGVYDSFMNI